MISVLLVVYNHLAMTRACVRALQAALAREPAELLVVDNGSTDGTPVWLRSLAGARVLTNRRNLGPTAAYNQALAAAAGEFVLLLHNDVLVAPGALTAMRERLQSEESVGLVSAVSLETEVKVGWSLEAIRNRAGVARERLERGESPRVLARGLRETFEGAFEDYAARFVTTRDQPGLERAMAWDGSCRMIRQEVAERLGGLDEGFRRAGAAAWDFLFRALEAGCDSHWATGAFAHHLHGMTSGRGRTEESAQDDRRLWEKWGAGEYLRRYLSADFFGGATPVELVSDWARVRGNFYGADYFDGPRSPYPTGHEDNGNIFGLAQEIQRTLQPRTSLDLGCGRGFLVRHLRNLGVDAVGVDCSEYALKTAPPEVRPYLRAGCLTRPGLDGRTFDLVTCIHALEHLPEPHLDYALRELRRHTGRYLLAIIYPPGEDGADPGVVTRRERGWWLERFDRFGFEPVSVKDKCGPGQGPEYYLMQRRKDRLTPDVDGLEIAGGLRVRRRQAHRNSLQTLWRPGARILVVRNEGLGDVLLTTPVLHTIKEQNTTCRLSYMTYPCFFPLLRHNPDVDRLLPFRPQLTGRNLAAHLERGLAVQQDYDAVLDLTRYCENSPYECILHRTDVFAHHAGLRGLGGRPFLRVGENEQRWALRFLARRGVGDGRLLLGLVPQASTPIRSWPEHHVREFAALVAQEEGVQMLLLGSRRPSGTPLPGVIDACGRTTVGQFCALIEKCDLVVSTDTGGAHVAGALGRPLVALFGSIAPELRLGRYENWTALRAEEVGCAPCFDRGCPEARCMHELTPERVWAAVRARLAEAAAGETDCSMDHPGLVGERTA